MILKNTESRRIVITGISSRDALYPNRHSLIGRKGKFTPMRFQGIPGYFSGNFCSDEEIPLLFDKELVFFAIRYKKL